MIAIKLTSFYGHNKIVGRSCYRPGRRKNRFQTCHFFKIDLVFGARHEPSEETKKVLNTNYVLDAKNPTGSPQFNHTRINKIIKIEILKWKIIYRYETSLLSFNTRLKVNKPVQGMQLKINYDHSIGVKWYLYLTRCTDLQILLQ